MAFGWQLGADQTNKKQTESVIFLDNFTFFSCFVLLAEISQLFSVHHLYDSQLQDQR